MASEKELIKQQLEQQEELANSPALAQRPTTSIIMTPPNSSKAGLFSASSASAYPFGGFPKGKLILPTALWVLLIMAGVCFLFLLGSLTKSMRTLDTLVELEIEQAQRDAIHLDNLEQTLSEATRAQKSLLNENRRANDKLIGSQDNWSSQAAFGPSNLLPFSWLSSSDGNKMNLDDEEKPRVISSSSVEYMVPVGSDGIISTSRLEGNNLDETSQMIKSVIDAFLQDEAATRSQVNKHEPENSDVGAQDGTKITANIDRIDVHINTNDNSPDFSLHDATRKPSKKQRKQNSGQTILVSEMATPFANNRQEQDDDFASLLSLLMQPTTGTKSKSHHNNNNMKLPSLIGDHNQSPFIKLATNDQDDLLGSILNMIERDAVENFKKDNNKPKQNQHHWLSTPADERPKIPIIKPTISAPIPISVISAPDANWLSDELSSFGSPASSSHKTNKLPPKSKMDEELENLANDLMLTLGNFAPSESKDKTDKKSSKGDIFDGDNIILFSSNEPSIGKNQKSQSLSLDEKPQEQKQHHLLPTEDKEISKLFKMFFGNAPSPDVFMFSSADKKKPSSSSNKNQEFPAVKLDDFIPTIEIKSNSNTNADNKPDFIVESFAEKQEQTVPRTTTTRGPSAHHKSASSPTTTLGPQLDIFVDAVLDELLPTAAQTSGDKSGARVEDKSSKESYTCQCEKGPPSVTSSSSVSSSSTRAPSVGSSSGSGSSSTGTSSGTTGSTSSGSNRPGGSSSGSSGNNVSSSSSARPSGNTNPSSGASGSGSGQSGTSSGSSNSSGNPSSRPSVGSSSGSSGGSSSGSSSGGSAGRPQTQTSVPVPIGYAAIPAGRPVMPYGPEVQAEVISPSTFGARQESQMRVAYQTAGNSTRVPAGITTMPFPFMFPGFFNGTGPMFFNGTRPCGRNGTRPFGFNGTGPGRPLGPRPALNLLSLP